MTEIAEDFNYRTACRADTMYLSTIKNNDAKIRKFKQINTTRDYSANLFNLDILGSSPKKFGVLHHKPDFTNRNEDIERSHPKMLHIGLNKPEYNLNSRDISGNSPSCVIFKTNREPFNPLEPKYNLPKVESIDPPVPKFIRDNIQINDIQGSFPRKYYKWETRNNILGPIDGSTTKKAKFRTTKYDNINYNDVTSDVFKTKRCVNPLDPVYEVKYKNNETYVHGMIEGSKPQTIYPFNYPVAYNLKVDDIDGSNVGSKNRINKFHSVYDCNLNVKDVPGAEVGSLKKGIVTQRNTNPINPKYKYIGDSEIGLTNSNNPYGKKEENKGKFEEIQLINPSSELQRQPSRQAPLESKKEEHQLLEDYLSNAKCSNDEKLNFDPDQFRKPYPNYSYVHDQYVLPSNSYDARPSKKQKSLSERKLKSNHAEDYSKTGSTFTRLTNAQKLDNLIQAKSS